MYCDDDGYLQKNDNGYSDHKFKMSGFMAYELHCEIHNHRTAECGKKEQSRFSGSVLRVVFGGYFVVYTHDHRNK